MNAMRARGHRLLLCAPERSCIYKEAQKADFQVHALDDHKAQYPLTIFKLARLFRREKVEVVNPHSSRDGWLGCIAARLAGVPVILRSRHIEVDYPNRFMSRIAFVKLPHHVITTSDKISARLVAELGLPADKVTCIATGVNLERFRPDVPGCVHAELGLAPETPIVGMISVLRSWKGHPIFIEAIKEILKRRPEAHFIIAGAGEPAGERMRKLIRERGLEQKITMLGHREDVPNVLASLTVLVLPSTGHEGIPQIILQAQAMARAVVGSAVGGIPEVVEDGKSGLLVPPNDPAVLAERIVQLLENGALREELGRQGRERLLREHSLLRMCERLEDLYSRYLK
jgi:glycosyltransferase involved in cell wall biosynthesis